MLILQILVFVLFPAAVIVLGDKRTLPGWLSPVILCYALGLLWANLGIPMDENMSMTLSEATIPIAIPLLLFSTNFLKWWKGAKKAVLSFGLCVLAISLSVFVGFLLFKEELMNAAEVGAMITGVYTGGTPNMSAIGMALEVPEETFILLNASDMVLGGIYLLFLMTIAKPLLGRFLPAYVKRDSKELHSEDYTFAVPFYKNWKATGMALLSGALILAVSVGVSMLFAGRITTILVILSVTSLGIAGSFINRIKSISTSYTVGEYLLLVFCMALGSLVDIQNLMTDASSVFWYCSLAMFGAIGIHFILSRLFKIDVDTVLITSVAAIYGPAFVGPIAKVLGNREILLTGMMTGLIGYAIGNYWGLMMSWFLHLFA